MFVICTLCAFGCGFWESLTGEKFQVYLPWEDFVPGQQLRGESPGDYVLGPVVIAALVFLSYVIVINTAVPISLYVRYLSCHIKSFFIVMYLLPGASILLNQGCATCGHTAACGRNWKIGGHGREF